MKKSLNILIFIIGLIILGLSVFSFFYIDIKYKPTTQILVTYCQSYNGIEEILHTHFKLKIFLNYMCVVNFFIGLCLLIISIIVFVKNKGKYLYSKINYTIEDFKTEKEEKLKLKKEKKLEKLQNKIQKLKGD